MTAHPPTTSAPTSSYYRWMILILGLVVLLLALYRMMNAQQQANPATSLRRITTVPPFALTERSGKQITNQDLAGKIWVADFVYTTCPGPCPIVTANMAKLQAQVIHDPKVQLVTFTVDPDSDTPAVLAAYADKFGADPNRWWFLTGPQKPLYDLIQNGFLQAIETNNGTPQDNGPYKVTHSTYLALVDGEGNVRGFYDGVGNGDRADLLRDIQTLEKEEAP